ncbi:MAG: hypothetical protein GF346_02505 [Candidatus Eisenbacteria bacterium]|nr:hypothetical protein [Candidatus Latescibacterota bacterium]MBD3301293.1 hypothetical protein [Candidatus Eisenbacteria bacterium]
MSEPNLILQIEEPLARLTVNRPAVLNALNRETLAELREAFASLDANEAVRAVVLTGAGEKAFIAGADIKELAGLPPLEAKEFAEAGQGVCDAIAGMNKPVIAAVNGFALGGGCEVALACHLRFGSTKARLGQPEVNLGVIPGWGGTQRLPRLVGRGAALSILLTGDPVDATEALRIGLLDRVVEPEALLSTCEETAKRIAARGPLAVRLLLAATRRGVDVPLPAGLAIEADAFGLAASTDDWREGTTAFLEKRKPEFRGR